MSLVTPEHTSVAVTVKTRAYWNGHGFENETLADPEALRSVFAHGVKAGLITDPVSCISPTDKLIGYRMMFYNAAKPQEALDNALLLLEQSGYRQALRLRAESPVPFFTKREKYLPVRPEA